MVQFAHFGLSMKHVYKVNVCFLLPWSFKKWFNALETKSLPLSDHNALIFCSLIASWRIPSTPWNCQNTPFWIQHIQPHFPWETINKYYKIPCTLYGCGPHGAPHIGIYNFQRFGPSPSLVLEIRPYIICLYYMFYIVTSVWGMKICQFSYHFSCSND